jgi:hypothetical protein
MVVDIYDVMDARDVLFGAAMGRACLSRLLEEAPEPATPRLLFLDFTQVASAT